MIKELSTKYLGLDKTILYTIAARAIQAGGGLFTIFLIIKFLTKDEQGYYYTFNSLLSIQIFFELGLSNIIVQYVAHEFAHASDDKLNITDREKLSGLSSLLHFFVKWYILLGVSLLIILVCAGLFFFTRFNTNTSISWVYPWIIISVATAVLFITTFFLAFVEGLGRITLVAKIRMFQQIVNVISTCLLLIFNTKLYTIGVSSLCVAIVVITYLLTKEVRKLVYEIWVIKSNVKFNYWQYFFPYQWRIALSWVGGYLIFQLFNPVLFAFSGAKVAGQMGATLAVLNGVIALSLSWVSTKVAIWSRWISLKKMDDLDKSFKLTLWQSSSINLLALIVFCLGIYYIGPHYPGIRDRFMSPFLLLLFSATFFINNMINCWATYLRCFKKEPFLIQSIIVGVLSAISTYVLGKYFGLEGIIKGYFFITAIVSLPLSYYLYRFYKNKFQRSI